MTIRSAAGACSWTARSISRAVATSIRLTPGGVGSATGPATRIVRAPRRAASAASAKPILPLERLPRKRTGSTGSWVGPAVTSTVRPASGPPPRGGLDRLHDLLRLGHPPHPDLPRGERPLDRTGEPDAAPLQRLDVLPRRLLRATSRSAWPGPPPRGRRRRARWWSGSRRRAPGPAGRARGWSPGPRTAPRPRRRPRCAPPPPSRSPPGTPPDRPAGRRAPPGSAASRTRRRSRVSAHRTSCPRERRRRTSSADL